MLFFSRKNLKYLDLAKRGSSRVMGGFKKLNKGTLRAVKSIASFGRRKNNHINASKAILAKSVSTPAQPSPMPDVNDEMLQVRSEQTCLKIIDTQMRKAPDAFLVLFAHATTFTPPAYPIDIAIWLFVPKWHTLPVACAPFFRAPCNYYSWHLR